MAKTSAVEKPLFELSPSVLNALFPLFVRNLFFAGLAVFFCASVLSILHWFGILSTFVVSLPVWIAMALLAALLSLSFRLIVHANTTYRFFRTHVVREFRFFIVRNYTVSYSHIANISIRISLWDRLCRAGDIVLHTADDDTPDLVLHYVTHPEEVEQRIWDLAEAEKPKVASSPLPSRRGR